MEVNHQFLGFKKEFDDPFMLPSSNYVPKSLTSALDLAVFLYYLNPTYRRAAERTVSHFITGLKFGDEASRVENTDWDSYFNQQLRIRSMLKQVGNEFMCYGNAFVYIHYPFVRYLHDVENKRFFTLSALKNVATSVQYDYKNLSYTLEIQGKKRTYNIVDLPTTTKDSLALRILDPRDVIIELGYSSGQHSYIFKIPQTWKQAAKDNVLHSIEDMPLHFLKAIANDKQFRFNRNELYHFKNPSISGVANEGWGIPEPILNYRMLHMLQVYYKIDEAIARDYMTPFRIFSPVPAGGGSGADSMGSTLVGARWKQEMRQMIMNKRKDPEAIHAFPFPIQYQAYGAEGKQLAPKDLIEFQSNEMLNAGGYPAELYRGTMDYQAAPMAYRAFENTFAHLYDDFDNFIKWVGERVSSFTNEDMAVPTLERPSVAEDVERKAILQGLYQAQAISNRTLFNQLNLGDPDKERLTRLEEDMEFQRKAMLKQQEMEHSIQAESMDSAAAQDQMAGGAMGGGGMTPMDVQDQSQQKAMEWMSMPEGPRRQAMQETKAMDPHLYAQAKQIMEEMRAQGAAEGRAAVNQQAQGGMM